MKKKIIVASLLMALFVPVAGAHAATVTPITSEANIDTYWSTAGNYRLDADIVLEGAPTLSGWTLDLNGHTITVNRYITAVNTVTIKDTTDTHAGKILGTSWGSVISVRNGKIVLQSGTIENPDGIAVGVSYGNGAFNMTGGTVISGKDSGIAVFNSDRGDISITGGTIRSNGTAISNTGNNCTINGATIISTSTTKPAIENKNYSASSAEEAMMTISGRTTISTPGTAIISTGRNLTINGGTIEAGAYAIKSTTVLEIRNGTFYSTGGTAIESSGTGSRINMSNGLIKTDSGSSSAVVLKDSTRMILNGGKIEALNENCGTGVKVLANSSLIVSSSSGTAIDSYCEAIIGSEATEGDEDGSNAKITVHRSIITSRKTAINAPQANGETIIYDSTVTGGDTAVRVGAGRLLVFGNQLNGGQDGSVTSSSTLAGRTAKNAAVAIEQGAAGLPIEAFICDGTLRADIPLIETNPNGNSAADLAKIDIAVGGQQCEEIGYDSDYIIELYSTGNTAVYSEDKKGFIYAGQFSHQIRPYVATGFVQTSLENGMYSVAEGSEATEGDNSNGTNGNAGSNNGGRAPETVKYGNNVDLPSTNDELASYCVLILVSTMAFGGVITAVVFSNRRRSNRR